VDNSAGLFAFPLPSLGCCAALAGLHLPKGFSCDKIAVVLRDLGLIFCVRRENLNGR
jgi:hypothetical protein